MSAYGEGGALRGALERLGADTEAAIDTMVTYGYENSQRAKEIAEQLSGVDVNTQEYRDLMTELANLTGEISTFEQAASDFAYEMNSLQGKIDWSELFLPDGSIDTNLLNSYLEKNPGGYCHISPAMFEAAKRSDCDAPLPHGHFAGADILGW